MSERALSEAAMLAGLADIRLPAAAAGGALAEIAAALALGCLGALAAAAVLRLFARRRARPAGQSLPARVAALRALPEAHRRTALLHLLKAHAPARYRALAGELYRRDGGPDLDAVEAELARHG